VANSETDCPSCTPQRNKSQRHRGIDEGNKKQNGVRQTNIDLIAARLNQAAGKGDLIVVSPCHSGISFYRYYCRAARWATVPPLDFLKFHRYDLIKTQMMARDQTQPVTPVMAAALAALRGGHRVWLVSDLRLLPHGSSLPLPPPAPSQEWGWREGLYSRSWTAMAQTYLRATAHRAQKVPVTLRGQVSRYEDLQVWMFEGWAPSVP
jgi:hypothetical protein